MVRGVKTRTLKYCEESTDFNPLNCGAVGPFCISRRHGARDTVKLARLVVLHPTLVIFVPRWDTADRHLEGRINTWSNTYYPANVADEEVLLFSVRFVRVLFLNK